MSIVRRLLATLGLKVDPSGFKNADEKIDKLKEKFGELRERVVGVAQAAATAAAAFSAFTIAGIVQNVAKIESLKASLAGVIPEVEAMNAKWVQLKQLARETPFDMDQVVNAFIRLESIGLDASDRTIKAFGDIAASFPEKTISDFTEAVADATTGEFERLKEFAIKAKKEGDKVSLSFKGNTIKVKNDAKSMQEALVQLAEQNFGGAMDRQMATLNGTWATMKQSALEFAEIVGESGLSASLQRLAETIFNATQGSDAFAVKLGGALASAVDWLGQAFIWVANNTDKLAMAAKALLAVLVVDKIAAFTSAVFAMGNGLIATAFKAAAAAPMIMVSVSAIAPFVAKFALIGGIIAEVVGFLSGSGGLLNTFVEKFSESDGTAGSLARSVMGIREALQQVLGAVMKLVEPLMSIVEPIVGLLAPAFQIIGSVIELIVGLAAPVFQVIGFLIEGFATVLGFVAELIADIMGPLLEGIGMIADGLRDAFQWLADGLSDVVSEFSSAVSEAAGYIEEAVGDATDSFSTWFDTVGSGFKQYMDYLEPHLMQAADYVMQASYGMSAQEVIDHASGKGNAEDAALAAAIAKGKADAQTIVALGGGGNGELAESATQKAAAIALVSNLKDGPKGLRVGTVAVTVNGSADPDEAGALARQGTIDGLNQTLVDMDDIRPARQ